MNTLWQALLLVAAFLSAVTAGSAVDHTGLVSWDRFSLSINGSRVFIQSGEFHYQRLPVPELWLDIFHKLKANGFNAVSIYFFWSYHSAAPGVFDFTSPGKNVQLVLDMAKEAGLWVIARPGPYCNAEINAGSLPLWGSDGSLGGLRTSDETYHQAWEPWISTIGKIIAKNEIGNGGPIILTQVENELTENRHTANDTLVVYMQQLETALRAAGITVPFTSNEKGMRGQSWSSDYQNAGGAVDVYGLDSYPGSLSCTNPSSGFNVLRTYHQFFDAYAPTQPVSFPEFEGGWFSAWGSPTFYDQCASEHSPEFADVYYKNNIGQRTSFQNLYMAYGGTNWGHSAAPVVYTSYDYSAPIRETRQQTTKLFQTKLINLFSTSSPDLLKTVMVGNGTGFHVSSSDVFTWVLQNPDTSATFTVLQQAATPSTKNVSTSVTLNTSAGTIAVPGVALRGRQSKILVTDYAFGSSALLYCSADIATSESLGDRDVLVLYLKEGQAGEFAFREAGGNITYSTHGASHVASTVRVSASSNTTHQVFAYTQAPGITAVSFSNNVLVLLLEQSTAWRLWAPQDGDTSLSATPRRRLLILGPYLVRSARVDTASGVLYVQGDNDVSTSLEAFVGSSQPAIHTIVWNGRHLPATQTAYGSYTAVIPGGRDRMKDVRLPLLLADNKTSTAAAAAGSGATWYAADSLPEAHPEFDDARWTVCNKTTTRSPVRPVTLPVLFSSDYGFYTGIKVYRGRFSSAAAATAGLTAVNITASGGLGFGWTAWVNGQLLGGSAGTGKNTTTSALLTFPKGSLVDAAQNKTNVLTVLVDYHGHDETSTRNGLGNPRGLLGAELVYGGGASNASSGSSGFSLWKIAGNAGGGRANLDAVRGPMNEGGLYGERLGWHLPGFDVAADKAFSSAVAGSSPLDGINGTAGVRFYVTRFSIGGEHGSGSTIPADLDVPLGIELSAPAGTVARVELWVNGYQYGKYVPHIGPQTVFPIPPGIINTGAGETNTLALSVWAMTAAGARLDRVAVVGYDDNAAYDTGFFAANAASKKQWKTDIEDLQPRWTDRSQFA